MYSIPSPCNTLAPELSQSEQSARLLELVTALRIRSLYCESDSEFTSRNAMLRLSDTIRRTDTPDGGILLDVHHGRMLCLNPVGAKIVELLDRGHDESRIVEELCKQYGVSEAIVRADVTEFVESLQKHQVLQTVRAT
jgi:hypothetical protein